MSYCGSGVPLSTHLGHKAALRLLGDGEGESAFAAQSFPTRPFCSGDPWFLAGAALWYRLRDRLRW